MKIENRQFNINAEMWKLLTTKYQVKIVYGSLIFSQCLYIAQVFLDPLNVFSTRVKNIQ